MMHAAWVSPILTDRKSILLYKTVWRCWESKHRGAVGADKSMGDGAGILTNIPDKLYRKSLQSSLKSYLKNIVME